MYTCNPTAPSSVFTKGEKECFSLSLGWGTSMWHEIYSQMTRMTVVSPEWGRVLLSCFTLRRRLLLCFTQHSQLRLALLDRAPAEPGQQRAREKTQGSWKKKKKKGRIFESVLFLFLINPNVCVRERSSASCFCSTAFRRLGSRRLLLPTFHLFLGVWSILITSCQRWLKDEFDEFYPHCNENLAASTGCVDRWILQCVLLFPPNEAVFVFEEILILSFPFTRVQHLEQWRALR